MVRVRGIALGHSVRHGEPMTHSDLTHHLPPPRRTLRDQLLEAEQLRCKLEITTVDGGRIAGTPSDVGIDYVALQTTDRTVDIALFHIVSIGW